MRKAGTERGQALGELTISLVAMCSVMIGLLTIACLGMSGVRNVIAVREKADRNSFNGFENGSPRNIDTWKTGSDGLLFTNDDIQVRGSGPNSGKFLGELTDNSGLFSTSQLAQTRYAEHAFESKVLESSLFLSAANLTQAEQIVSDPLSLYRHFDAARIWRGMGFNAVFTIKDTVWMPVNPLE